MADNDNPQLLEKQKLGKFLSEVSVRFPDSPEFFMVSKDKASLVFMQWRDRIKSRSAWQTPFALVVSLAITLATATFADQTWIKAGTIKGIFAAMMAGSFGWLLYEVIRLAKNRAVTPEQFIAELAEGTKEPKMIPLPDQSVK